MILRRILGGLFILLGTVFSLCFLTLFPKDFYKYIRLFLGKLDAYQIGELIGSTFFWACFIAATVALWKHGIKWVGGNKKQAEHN